jgi:hypothetical protein
VEFTESVFVTPVQRWNQRERNPFVIAVNAKLSLTAARNARQRIGKRNIKTGVTFTLRMILKSLLKSPLLSHESACWLLMMKMY